MPLMWALRPFRGILRTLKGIYYSVYSRYVKIPGLTAHTRGARLSVAPWLSCGSQLN